VIHPQSRPEKRSATMQIVQNLLSPGRLICEKEPPLIHRVKRRHYNPSSQYDIHVVSQHGVLCEVKHGEDLSHYSKKIKSYGLRRYIYYYCIELLQGILYFSLAKLSPSVPVHCRVAFSTFVTNKDEYIITIFRIVRSYVTAREFQISVNFS